MFIFALVTGFEYWWDDPAEDGSQVLHTRGCRRCIYIWMRGVWEGLRLASFAGYVKYEHFEHDDDCQNKELNPLSN